MDQFKDERLATHINVAIYPYHAVELIRTLFRAIGIHASWEVSTSIISWSPTIKTATYLS